MYRIRARPDHTFSHMRVKADTFERTGTEARRRHALPPADFPCYRPRGIWSARPGSTGAAREKTHGKDPAYRLGDQGSREGRELLQGRVRDEGGRPRRPPQP